MLARRVRSTVHVPPSDQGHPCLPVSTQAPPRCKTPSTLLCHLFVLARRYAKRTTYSHPRNVNKDTRCYKQERKESKKSNPSSRQPYRVKIKNQQQHDLHARPRWMHEWSYAALKQLQNSKLFVIAVARIPPIYLCTSAASGGHRYTRCPFVRCGGEWCRSED